MRWMKFKNVKIDFQKKKKNGPDAAGPANIF